MWKKLKLGSLLFLLLLLPVSLYSQSSVQSQVQDKLSILRIQILNSEMERQKTEKQLNDLLDKMKANNEIMSKELTALLSQLALRETIIETQLKQLTNLSRYLNGLETSETIAWIGLGTTGVILFTYGLIKGDQTMCWFGAGLTTASIGRFVIKLW